MNFVILASGTGNRVKSLTKNYPKALIKITKKLRIFDFINFTLPLNSRKIVILGYKFNYAKKFFLKKNYLIIKNKKYFSTNMVETMFCSIKKLIKNDVIVLYSDIIFEKKIISKLTKIKGNVMPLNKNWYNSWKKRMSIKKILEDAENIETKGRKILSIGERITSRIPKYQYMGIIKFKYSDFLKLNSFYKKQRDNKIDLTSLLNIAIKKKVIDINFISSTSYWAEIDTLQDYKTCKKNIKNELPENYIRNIEKQL